jgi:hypothetical protein
MCVGEGRGGIPYCTHKDVSRGHGKACDSDRARKMATHPHLRYVPHPIHLHPYIGDLRFKDWDFAGPETSTPQPLASLAQAHKPL